MTTTTSSPSTAIAVPQPVFTPQEQLAPVASSTHRPLMSAAAAGL